MPDIFDKVAEDKTDVFDRVGTSIAEPAPAGPDPSKKAEAETFMGEAWKTAQDIGHVYPVAEAAAHVVTNLYGLPISGLVGLAGLLVDTETSLKWMDITNDLLVYQPQTERGARFTQSALYPFELLTRAGKHLGETATEHGAPWYVAAGIDSVVVASPALVGLRNLPKAGQALYNKATKSTAWRQATIKERGLVVQSIEEVLAKNPKLTEAELARQSHSYFEQSLKRVRNKKAKEKKQTNETARRMGEEIKEPQPAEPPTPGIKNIFKDIGELTKQEIDALSFKERAKVVLGEGATPKEIASLAKQAEAAVEKTKKKPIPIEAIKEYEQIAGEASRRAEANLEKHYRVITDAEFIPRGTDAKSLQADVQRIAQIEEEINVFNEILKNEPITKRGRILGETVARGIKTDIRKNTGQVKVKDVIEVSQGAALKDQIKLEAKAAREAFSAGKKEAALAHKLKQRELVIRQRTARLQRNAVNKMVRDIKKINVKRMSPQAAEPIKDIVSGIDLTRLTKPKKVRLEGLRRHLQDNPEAELPAKRFEELSRLDRKNLNEMSFNELSDIHESVMHYVHLDKLKNRIKVGRQRRQTAAVLKSSISEMKPPAELTTEIVSSQLGGKPQKRVGQLIKDTFGIRHDHYDLMVESIAGRNSTIDKVLYQDVKEGILKQYAHRQSAYAKFQKAIEPVVKKVGDIDSWLSETVKTGRFELTRNQRMALYRHSLNIDNIEAVLAGGIGFKRSQTPNKVHKISQNELDAIIKSLTPEEKAFAGKPIDALYKAQAQSMGEVFYEKNGYPLEIVENYYPKEVMPRARGGSAEQESVLEKYKGRYVRVGVEKGRLIERIGSTKPIYLNDLTNDVNKSILQAAAYVGLEIPLSNASKLLYNDEFRTALSERYGNITWNEIEKGLRDIANDYRSYTTVEELMLKAKNNLATAVLGLNPFVMAKQLLSLPVYLPFIEAEYLTQGMGDYIMSRTEVMNRHKIYSPEYVERVSGGFSRDVADVFKGGSEKRLFGGKKNIREKTMGGIKLLDEMAVSIGMQGGVLMVLDQFKAGKLSEQVRVTLDITDADIPNLSAADKMRLAYKYVDSATQRTQPMFSPEHLSSLQRGSATEKLFTMFGSFTNQALNLIRRASREYRRAKTEQQKAAASAKLAKVLLAIAVLNPLGVMAIDTIRDKLYGREKTGTFLGRLPSSYASYVFFIRDIVNSAISKIERGTFQGYDVDIPVMVVPNLMTDSIANAYTAVYGTNKQKRQKASNRAVDSSLRLIFTMNGIPYSTPKKLIGAGIKQAKKASESSREN